MPMTHRNLIKHRNERLYRLDGSKIVSNGKSIQRNKDMSARSTIPQIKSPLQTMNSVYTANRAFNFKYSTIRHA